MARPPVQVSELVEIGGLTAGDVSSFLEDGEVLIEQRVWPVSRVWPMGFSWSPFVGQSQMLHACGVSGLSTLKYCHARPLLLLTSP